MGKLYTKYKRVNYLICFRMLPLVSNLQQMNYYSLSTYCLQFLKHIEMPYADIEIVWIQTIFQILMGDLILPCMGIREGNPWFRASNNRVDNLFWDMSSHGSKQTQWSPLTFLCVSVLSAIHTNGYFYTSSQGSFHFIAPILTLQFVLCL